MEPKKDFEILAESLGLQFNNVDYLRQAMVHRSYLNEHRDFALDHNERLEFLGDAVLELIVTEYLYNNYPNPEGELTTWRAALVNAKMLSTMARESGLEPYLHLSKGEAKDTGKARDYILANAYEALIGAIYLDKGWDESKKFIEDKLLSRLEHILEHKLYMDPKSKFQEMAQERLGITPNYQVVGESGPDHEKIFEIAVVLSSDIIGKGKGSSKQEAQMAAAEDALKNKGWN